jgi:hypothetical protein
VPEARAGEWTALADQLSVLAGEQSYLASDFEEMRSDAGRATARLCATRARTLEEAACALIVAVAEVRRLHAELTRVRQILAATPGQPEHDPAEAEWSAALGRPDV